MLSNALLTWTSWRSFAKNSRLVSWNHGCIILMFTTVNVCKYSLSLWDIVYESIHIYIGRKKNVGIAINSYFYKKYLVLLFQLYLYQNLRNDGNQKIFILSVLSPIALFCSSCQCYWNLFVHSVSNWLTKIINFVNHSRVASLFNESP